MNRPAEQRAGTGLALSDETPETPPMVLLEFSVTPLNQGESVSPYVARCVELVAASGLDYRLHAMGTIVEGDLLTVLDLMRRCIEAVAVDCDRVTCAAKLDYRRGHSGRLDAKVRSVIEKLAPSPKTV
jgi:uncharacterized protein (TIGR00106 family)